MPLVEWQTCRPAAPTSLTRGGDIKLPIPARWDASRTRNLVHYFCKESAVVVSFKLGQGEVVWWASAVPLTNAGIKEAANLELLLNSIGNRNSRVLWDEYFHGREERSLWDSVADTPLRWALVQLAIVALALVVTFSRRSGPLRPLVEESRLSPLEFVRTLGGLYQSAQASNAAVEASFQRFRQLLTRRLVLRADTPAAELARAAQTRLGFNASGFAETLQRCEQAIVDPDLTERQAVELTQALNEYLRQLQLIPIARALTHHPQDRRAMGAPEETR